MKNIALKRGKVGGILLQPSTLLEKITENIKKTIKFQFFKFNSEFNSEE